MAWKENRKDAADASSFLLRGDTFGIALADHACEIAFANFARCMPASQASGGVMKNRKFIRHSARVLSIVLAASLVMSGCGAKSGTGATEAATAATSSLWESTEGTTTSAEADADSSEILQKAMDSFTGSRSSKDGKDETVYVVADSNGTAQNVIVSEHLMNAKGAKTIQDESELKDIENVNGYEKFTQNGTKLTWDANGNDIYYRGTTDKKLPVDVKVSYKLDGKDISPEDLAGKDGKVTIRFDYTNNEKQTIKIGDEEQEVSVPFAMISGVILPDDHFSDVEVTNGRVLSEGKNNVIMGMAFPGLKESINVDKLKEDAVDDDAKKKIDDVDIPEYVEITANAKDFQLDMTMTTAMSDFLSNINLTSDLQDDTNDIKDQMGDLQDGSDKLVDGTKDLKKGTSDLKDGTTKLANGANDLKDGTGKLASGANDLKDGTGKLADGTDTLKDGTTKLKDGSVQLADGTNQLKSGIDTLKGGTQELADKTAALPDGASELDNGAGQLRDGIAAADDGAHKLSDGASQVKAGVNKLVGSLGTISKLGNTLDDKINTLQTQSDQLTDAETKLKGGAAVIKTATDVDVELGSLLTASGLDKTQIGAMKTAFEQAVQQSKGKVTSEDISTLKTALAGALEQASTEENKRIDDSLASSAAAMFVAVKASNTAAQQMDSGLYDLFNSLNVADLLKQLKESKQQMDAMLDPKTQEELKQLTDGVGALESGASDLANGTSQLKDGSEKLKDGTAQLVSQSGQLVDGINQLNDGASQLQDGASQVANGAGDLEKGLIDADNGVADLQKGAHDLDDGAGDLQKGTNDLDKGASDLVDGVIKLDDGAGDLDSGAAELADGMLKLNDDGIEKLTELFGDNLSDAVDRINAVVDTGTDYKSFAGTADPDNTSVKFIYKTGEIKKK